jgi:hypothetical protein
VPARDARVVVELKRPPDDRSVEGLDANRPVELALNIVDWAETTTTSGSIFGLGCPGISE